MEFTYTRQKELLKVLQLQGFSFVTFNEYINLYISSTNNNNSKQIILRHDVEQEYKNAMNFAQTQNQQGIKGTYFFRIIPKWFKPEIVLQIAKLGHEIGYHYDDLTECKGDYQKAIARFERNLQTIRDIAPVQTICMDGSPLSFYDNKDLWTKYNYKDYGIIGEPYFNIDFNDIFYLTDTGRRWDGWNTSIRDKVLQQDEWIKQGLVFHSTSDIIQAAKEDRLPDKMMITFHPQRWNDKPLPWLKELVWQNVKNQLKRIVIKVRSK